LDQIRFEGAGKTMAEKYSWKFKPKMRARSYGWQGTQKAVSRLKEAVSEIKVVARKDPVLAGEGVVCLMERIWPAFEHIDTSSGALGGAIYRTLNMMIPILVKAPADQRTRAKWLKRLVQAFEDDGVDYLAPVEERFGEIAVYPDLIKQYADDRLEFIKMAWSQGDRFGFVHGTSICLSCLLEAGRHEELMALLGLRPSRNWYEDKFGMQSLLRQGRIEDALAFAEQMLAGDRPTYSHGEIAQFCEGLLLQLGRSDEAYRVYGLPNATGTTYLGTYRSLVKRYPERDTRAILIDLMEEHGASGKWFAAAKDAGHLDIALDCAAQSSVEPATLIRAARDFQEKNPRFAATVALQAVSHLLGGRGYEPTRTDVEDAMRYLHQAACKIDAVGWAKQSVQRLLAHKMPDVTGFQRVVEDLLPMFDQAE
jgi:hypothetical protein